MKRYARGQFTITYYPAAGIAPAASSLPTANPLRAETDMGRIEAQTIHTVKLSWMYRDALDKRDLIDSLTTALPDSALIADLSVSATVTTKPGTTDQAVMRTLTITYVSNPVLDRYGRP